MLKLLGAIIVLAGVIFIFDARKITKKLFSFGDQNEGTLGLKMTGFIVTMLGAAIIWFTS